MNYLPSWVGEGEVLSVSSVCECPSAGGRSKEEKDTPDKEKC